MSNGKQADGDQQQFWQMTRSNILEMFFAE
jgi:hypothetical protein